MYLTESYDEKIRDNYHCVLIAKNYEGFKELNKLISKSFYVDHYYYEPRILIDDVVNTSENIIVTTACVGGVFGKGNDAVKEKISNKVLWYSISIVIVGISCAVAMALSLDYDYHAIIVAYIFYIFYDKPILGAGLGYLSIIKELYSCLGFAMTVTYNGERGKQNKWINYLFYPVHILILGILRFYLNI